MTPDALQRYQDALAWWKAEALLQACGKGQTIDRLVLAVINLVPISPELAEAHLADAKAVVTEFLDQRQAKREEP